MGCGRAVSQVGVEFSVCILHVRLLSAGNFVQDNGVPYDDLHARGTVYTVDEGQGDTAAGSWFVLSRMTMAVASGMIPLVALR